MCMTIIWIAHHPVASRPVTGGWEVSLRYHGGGLEKGVQTAGSQTNARIGEFPDP